MTGAIPAVGLAMLLTLAAAPPVSAADTIRVAVVESARVVELRGVDIDVTELGGCPACASPSRRAALVRATAAGGGVEIDGVRSAGFRLGSEQAHTL